MVSAAYLGNLGTQQLGAVSLASLATSLATYVFSFLVFLTTPRIAAAHAVGDRAAVSRLAAVGLWLAGSTGLAVGVGMWFGADAIVSGEPCVAPPATVRKDTAVPPLTACARILPSLPPPTSPLQSLCR